MSMNYAKLGELIERALASYTSVQVTVYDDGTSYFTLCDHGAEHCSKTHSHDITLELLEEHVCAGGR